MTKIIVQAEELDGHAHPPKRSEPQLARPVPLSQELLATAYSLINPLAIKTQRTRNFRFNL